MNMTLQRRRSIKANDIIHDQFFILGKLDNQKHSSKLLKGFDKITRNFVVVKITSAAYKEKNKYVTKILQKLRGGTGVPNIVWRGEIVPDTITVTECLGPNLKKLFLLMDKQFAVPTIAMIAIQVLNTLEYIHSHDYVCCNIMPKEILISLHKKSLTLFITDYKQARKVKSGRLAATDNVSHTANKAILNKFSSVNLHLGLPASKKDDLESLGYILVYFFRNGGLFEKKAKISTKEEKIKYHEQQKLTLIPETFCQGLPQEMVSYMTHIKAMQTNQGNEKIDYDYLRKLFRNLFSKSGGSTDTFQYDWISKARTYNLESGKKAGEEKVSLEHSFKTELISIQSPVNQGSDVLTEFEDNKEGQTAPFAIKRLHYMQSEEYDPVGMDEFTTEENSNDLPISLKFQKIGIFQEKIKTIEHLKSRSLHNLVIEGLDAYYAGDGQKGVIAANQGTSDSSPSKPGSDKSGSRSAASSLSDNKISNFGKAHLKQKSIKTK